MAGKDLYIQPIIDNSLSAMTSNIASMNTQLSETTRILMNILNNQGLEQHQEAYGGATFSALTMTADAAEKNMLGTSISVNADHSFSVGGSFTLGTGLKVYESDLTNIDKITITESYLYYTIVSSSAPATNTFRMSLVKNGQIVETFNLFDVAKQSALANETAEVYLTENLKQNYDYILFDASVNGTKGYIGNIVIKSLYIGDTLIYPQEVPAIVFNSNNLLTYDSNIAAGYEVAYNKAKTAYITIPDIQGVATWVSAILKGHLDGVSVALVDNSTHDLIKVLPTATSDISDVNELSGLALMVTFAGDGNSLKFMSGFTMRYY